MKADPTIEDEADLLTKEIFEPHPQTPLRMATTMSPSHSKQANPDKESELVIIAFFPSSDSSSHLSREDLYIEYFDYEIPIESNGNESEDRTLVIIENDFAKDSNANGDAASVESQDDKNEVPNEGSHSK